MRNKQKKKFVKDSTNSERQYDIFSSVVSFALAIASATKMTAMLVLQGSLRSALFFRQSSLWQNNHSDSSKFTVVHPGCFERVCLFKIYSAQEDVAVPPEIKQDFCHAEKIDTTLSAAPRSDLASTFLVR